MNAHIFWFAWGFFGLVADWIATNCSGIHHDGPIWASAVAVFQTIMTQQFLRLLKPNVIISCGASNTNTKVKYEDTNSSGSIRTFESSTLSLSSMPLPLPPFPPTANSVEELQTATASLAHSLNVQGLQWSAACVQHPGEDHWCWVDANQNHIQICSSNIQSWAMHPVSGLKFCNLLARLKQKSGFSIRRVDRTLP